MAELYVPIYVVHPPPAHIGSSLVDHGNGPPTGDPGLFEFYIDDDSNDVYNNVNNVWVIQASGGGSGAIEVKGGSADPTNLVSVEGRGIYLRSADVNGDRRIYVRNLLTTGSDGWEPALTYQV